MQSEKIIGLILLLVGIGVIIYTLWLSFGIFTGQSFPPELFKIAAVPNGVSDNTKSTDQLQGLSGDIQNLVQEKLQGQFDSLIPKDTVPKLLNLISWSILAGIFILGGSHISGIGIKMLKK